MQLYGKYKGLYKKIVDLCLTICFQNSQYIICHSAKIKKWVESYNLSSNAKAVISSMGANSRLFYSRDLNESKANIGFSPSDTLFVDTGSFTPWGGEEFLISAMDELNKRGSINKKFLVLTSNGFLFEKCRTIVSDRGLQNHVIFKNSIPYEKVPDFINAADLCFCLKRHELDVTSPNRLFEYIFCKRPVVVTSAYKPYFQKFNGIIYVDPTNIKAIADIMENFGSIAGTIPLQHDYEEAIKEHSWDAIVSKLLQELRL